MSAPAPLISPDVDVRDLDGFMLNTERLLASELIAVGNSEEVRAALILWCRAWKQIPAASLPDDDKILAGFAMVPLAKWKRIKANALRGFVKCSDGRLYHHMLASEALSAWDKKKSYQARRANDAARLERWRNEKDDEKKRVANGVSRHD